MKMWQTGKTSRPYGAIHPCTLVDIPWRHGRPSSVALHSPCPPPHQGCVHVELDQPAPVPGLRNLRGHGGRFRRRVRRRRRAGGAQHVHTGLELGRPAPADSGVVPGREVRDLLPLGRLQRPRLRQRVVPARHVPGGQQGQPSPRRDLRPAVGMALPQLHQRGSGPGGQHREVRAEAEVGRREVRPRRVGSAVRRRRRQVRRPGRRAP